MKADGYAKFLKQKRIEASFDGLKEIREPHKILFPFQRDIVKWALRRGRACLWEDCGLGKTFQSIEWCRQIPGDTLIVAPLNVTQQTIAEGRKIGADIRYCRHTDRIQKGITITNYEMLESLDVSRFKGVALDESSILKNFDGKTRNLIIDKFARTPYKLACTATPSPNDHMELGNHAEFMGAMSRTEMLSMFFVHDGGETSKWRLKGHAEKEFWKWICSWAVMIRKPSDLGYEDDGFKLPPLNMVEHIVKTDTAMEGFLIPMPASSLSERRNARRASQSERVKVAAELVNSSDESWVLWCNLNSESQALAEQIPNALEVTGSDSMEYRSAVVEWFLGNKCICNDAMFRNKVATWRALNTSNSIIGGTELKGCATAGNITRETKPSATPTADLITKPIGANGTKEHQSSALDTTKTGAKNTEATPRIVSSAKSILGNIELNIHCHAGTPSCEGSESSATTPKSSRRKKVSVSSVKTAAECTSITATRAESSEACCAGNVISPSANSQTIQKHSNGQQCICGHNSEKRRIVSKASIFGFGLNLQNCHNTACVGISDSYEELYQLLRRFWRFGQTKPVNAHIIISDMEGAVLANIKRKEADATKMAQEMVKEMHSMNEKNIKGTSRTSDAYHEEKAEGKNFTLYLGDCIDVCKKLKAESIGYSIFSPPFASLYTYSASERDLGNVKNDAEFHEHFRFVIAELFRVMQPGRLVSFHCMDIPSMKSRDGMIGLKDFPAQLIKSFQAAGFIYHSRVVIWKDPLIEATRTKALGLMHKQIQKDSSMCRQGLPDYLITMRKPGESKAIAHPDGFTRFIGLDEPKAPRKKPTIRSRDIEAYAGQTADDPVYSHQVWRRYASPVWMDINQTRTLQRESAREAKDERHIAPLQLDVIERGMELWSNPGDMVLSPFAGIGSEGYVALLSGRKFVGAELKKSYWIQALANLQRAESEASHDLFASKETEAA